jgi:hypothetical protein
MPSVVAIVLNWCRESDTAACIDSLLASDDQSLGVLLVDNGSPDGSGDRLHARYPTVSYLQTGANLGYAAGNNRGMTTALEAGANYLLLLNDDTVVDRSCVRALVRAAEETGAAVVTPRILYFDEPTIVWYDGGTISRLRALGIHTGQDAPPDARRSRAPTSFVCGCCFLIRADVARDTGGFDERFFAYAEDVELSLRLSRDSHRAIHEPSAVVWHRQRRGAAPSSFQIVQRDRNRRRLVRLHYSRSDRMAFALWFYPTRFAHFAGYAVRFDWGRAAAVWRGAFSGLAT